MKVLACGLLLWLVPMALLVLTQGWDHTLTQMAWFFTKAALLTFGGAYAVLPYVNQAAVEHYQWLSTGQMMDGLALGVRRLNVLLEIGVVVECHATLFTHDILGLEMHLVNVLT